MAANETPRDETAFSLDPSTGAPVASLKTIGAANEAMMALAKGQGEESPHIQGLAAEGLDEAGYNAAVQPSDQEIEAALGEETSNSGDVTPTPAPESGASGSTPEE